jgi:hypothetical protein
MTEGNTTSTYREKNKTFIAVTTKKTETLKTDQEGK